MSERIKYWTQSQSVRNFGDDLSRFLLQRGLLAPRISSDIYRIIGSVIDRHIISRDLNEIRSVEGKISFWCCGVRDDTGIEEAQRQFCRFFGVRGPLTRDVLQLPADTPLGDPAFLMPLLYEPRFVESLDGKSLCIPHFIQTIDPQSFLEIVKDELSLTDEVVSEREILDSHVKQMLTLDRAAALSGTDIALAVEVRSDQEIRDLIDAIVSANFVLTGSLHVAIIACAYGRPFAFWDSGFVDIPFKWADFAASIGVACEFVHNLEEGRASYDRIRADIRLPKLTPILECCPFHVHPELMDAAIARDAHR